MHQFRFKNIWLISHAEKRAKHVKFHPNKNLLVGRNHTGKTTLIRSLFETLGAKPQGKLEEWDKSATSLLEFSVDDKSYFALYHSGRRALFDSQLNILISTIKHGEWSELFCKITNFNLVFTDKKQAEVVPADPACFFAPFYINQDGSWQSDWNTFTGMQRFSAPYKPIIEYFTGVCPPKYYTASADKKQYNKVLEEQYREYRLLERTIERFSKTVPLLGTKINSNNFHLEIQLLVKEVNKLNIRQELFRKNAVREQELLKNIEHQIHLADLALATYKNDTAYIIKEGSKPLICPTCHAEHDKAFLDLLEYADDARVLQELVARLRDDHLEVQQRVRKAVEELDNLNDNYTKISQLLETRKGDMKLQDVIGNLGAESAFEAFEAERETIQDEITRIEKEINKLDLEMKGLRSPQRTKSILAEFREHYSLSRTDLKLHQVKTKAMQLNSRPSLSGSGGPRSILSYYASIWKTVHGKEGTYDIPIVIDSPNQQAQDDFNLPAVLNFISRKLPEGIQLIVGLETATKYIFDNEVKLSEKYHMLTTDDWEKTHHLIEPLLMKMYEQAPSE